MFFNLETLLLLSRLWVLTKKGKIRNILVLGARGSGKSAIIQKYTRDTFSEKHVLTQEPKLTIKRTNEGLLQVWEVMHMSGVRSLDLYKNYLEDADGMILVYDCRYPKTIEGLEKWYNKALSVSNKQTPLVVVANKIDLYMDDLSNFSRDDGLNFAIKLSNSSIYEIPFIETSAKLGINISRLFSLLIDEMI